MNKLECEQSIKDLLRPASVSVVKAKEQQRNAQRGTRRRRWLDEEVGWIDQPIIDPGFKHAQNWRVARQFAQDGGSLEDLQGLREAYTANFVLEIARMVARELRATDDSDDWMMDPTLSIRIEDPDAVRRLHGLWREFHDRYSQCKPD